MSKLVLDTLVPPRYDPQTWAAIVRAICTQTNAASEGAIEGAYNALSAAPSATVVPAARGDIVRNLSPSETGTGGSKYVVLGWVCVTSGAPGTWRDMRVLTGN